MYCHIIGEHGRLPAVCCSQYLFTLPQNEAKASLLQNFLGATMPVLPQVTQWEDGAQGLLIMLWHQSSLLQHEGSHLRHAMTELSCMLDDAQKQLTRTWDSLPACDSPTVWGPTRSAQQPVGGFQQASGQRGCRPPWSSSSSHLSLLLSRQALHLASWALLQIGAWVQEACVPLHVPG